MNKEFISYEQALALRELGFDKCVINVYCLESKELVLCEDDEMIWAPVLSNNGATIAAPLKQQAFRFFREKHKLVADIRSEHLGYYTSIGNRDVMMRIVMKPVNIFETYEEAESACLEKLIEIVKNKENDNT